jgi:hypothetical protein
MVGNRVVVVFGWLILCSALAGCGGAPFVADDGSKVDALDADAGTVAEQPDTGSVDPLNDAGTAPAADSDTDAGSRDDHDAAKPDSGAEAHDGGEVPDGGSADAGPSCDGGPVYVHHVGLMNLTWSDCTPNGTYNAQQALAACAAYAAASGSDAGACTLHVESSTLQNVCGSTAGFEGSGAQAFWLYEVSNGQKGNAGHVATDGACPTTQDSSWD